MIPPKRAPQIEEIEASLEPSHREAMLELILAWGSLDGALGIMLAAVLGVPIAQGAEIVHRLPTSAKFEEIRKYLRSADGGDEAARIVKKHKRTYEKYTIPRNRIAHSHCAGFWRVDSDYIVFATYERVGDGDRLAVDAVPIQEMRRAARWGRAMTQLALQFVDARPQPNEDDDGGLSRDIAGIREGGD